jgi:cell division protein FtsB
LIRRHWVLAAGALVLLCAWTWSCIMYGPNGWLDYRKRQAEYQRLQLAVQQMQQENDRLVHHIKGLQSDPRVIEDEARKQGYVRPGERIYILPQPPPGVLKMPVHPGRGEQAGAGESHPVSTRLAMGLAIAAIITSMGTHRLWLRRMTKRAPPRPAGHR